MLLQFERGSEQEPKGHALAYFRSAENPDEVLATYLIVPPIAIDLGKYMPPMMAGQVSIAEMAASVSAVPLPPVPEKFAPGLGVLKQLAAGRDDDLLFLGEATASDVQGLLLRVGEAAQAYLAAYGAHQATLKEPEPATPELSGSVRSSLEEVLSGLMTDRERVAELVKLISKLQYATQGRDAAQEAEAVQEIEELGRHLPSTYQVSELLAAARLPAGSGQQLCELRLARCYKLCNEDYLAVQELERQIGEAQNRPG